MEPNQYNGEVQSNSEIRALSRNQLKGKWIIPVITALTYFILTSILNYIPIPGTGIDLSGFFPTLVDSEFYDEDVLREAYSDFTLPILVMLLSGALAIGLCSFHLTFAKGREAELPQIFDGFKQFLQAFLAGILMSIITFIGFMLFIIPGVIAALGLSQTYFIMADKPGVKATDAMQQSWEMMKGYKGQMFLLYLSFIPWAFLCLFTCGIGFLWLMPYMYVSYSNFYLQRKGEDLEKGLEDHLIVG